VPGGQGIGKSRKGMHRKLHYLFLHANQLEPRKAAERVGKFRLRDISKEGKLIEEKNQSIRMDVQRGIRLRDRLNRDALIEGGRFM